MLAKPSQRVFGTEKGDFEPLRSDFDTERETKTVKRAGMGLPGW